MDKSGDRQETTQEDGRLQEPAFKTTEGEYLVGKSFNPGGHEQVTAIKAMAAQMIDYIRANGKNHRCTNIAINNIEGAAMWAVKSVTKEPRT